MLLFMWDFAVTETNKYTDIEQLEGRRNLILATADLSRPFFWFETGI